MGARSRARPALEPVALGALWVGLAACACHWLPVERAISAQEELFATGVMDLRNEASRDVGALEASSAANASEFGPVDAAIVLGYSLQDGGVPTLPLVARVHLGVQLFCSGRARNLIFSGAAGKDASPLMTEADAMAKLAVTLIETGWTTGPCRRRGLPLGAPRRVGLSAVDRSPDATRDRYGDPLRSRELSGGGWVDTEDDTATVAPRFKWVLEESSTSTRENAMFSREICRARGWRTAAVVTNRFHQYRAGATFETLAKDFDVRVAVAKMPEDLETSTQYPPREYGLVRRASALLRGQWNVLRECAAIALYFVRGWL